MTLNDLICKAQLLAQQFSTGDIPLYDGLYREIQDIDLTVEDNYDDEGPYIIVDIWRRNT